MDTLHGDAFTSVSISRWFFLTTRNAWNKRCRENQNTCFTSSNFPPPENLALYEKISKHLVEPERPQIIWHMRVSCWILKATRVQAHSRSSSPTPTHTHTHTKICNTYCFSTATVVYWTRLNLTLYVHCPSSFCSNSPSCSLSVIRPYLFLYYDCSGLFLCLHYKHRVQTYLPQQDSNPQFQKATG